MKAIHPVAALVASLFIHRAVSFDPDEDHPLAGAMQWLAATKSRSEITAPGPAPGPGMAPIYSTLGGPAPAPSPGLPGLEALHITFEIKNFNYFDLTKETCPKKVKIAKKKKGLPSAKADNQKGILDHLGDRLDKSIQTVKSKSGDAEPNVDEAVDDVHGHSEQISKDIENGLDDVGKHIEGGMEVKTEAPGLPWMKKKDASSLLQVALGACAPLPDLTETKSPDKCSTVMDVLRDAIKETVLGIIACMWQKSLLEPMAPGPAPSPAALPGGLLPAAPAGAAGLVPLPPQSFLGPGPSPGPAPGPAPSGAPVMPDVRIFVTFTPGREVEGGRSTIVDIAFIDSPANGIDDIALAMPLITLSMESGLFKKQIKSALHAVTGIKPKIHGLEMNMKTIESFHTGKCEKHLKGIVKGFSLYYTRNQVPMALYNECTNFLTKMSFSHDYVLDPMDTVRCRRATRKFAEKWNHGSNAKEKDFEKMCFHACEAKYGRNAPTCNLHAGDKLLKQPQL